MQPFELETCVFSLSSHQAFPRCVTFAMQRQVDITKFCVPSVAGPPSEQESESKAINDVEEEWGLQTMEVDESSGAACAQTMLELLQKAHATYGGLEKFLQVRFQKQGDLQAFVEYLSEISPCGSGHEFCVPAELPTVTLEKLECSESLRIHPASFAFLETATVRGPAEADTVMRLAEELLKDGLVTSTEPLLLTQSEQLTNDVVKSFGDEAGPHHEETNVLHVVFHHVAFLFIE